MLDAIKDFTFAGALDFINEEVVKLQFTFGARIEFYEALSLLMENGVQLNDALAKLYDIASKYGEKPNSPRAIIYGDVLDGLNEGKNFSELMRKWVNSQEVSLLSAGERSGDMTLAFANIINVIEKKRAILGAIAMATVYPTFLFGMACFLLNMVSTRLVPKLVRTTNPETWEGAARVLYLISEYVNNYGRASLIAIEILIAAILISLPYLRGPLRIHLDKLFPWSLYRMLHGSTFLLNVAIMQDSGIQLKDALQSLARNANPWLRERIDAALYGTGIGNNIGEALDNAGYGFPDQRAIDYLMVLANQEGFEKAIARFGNRWMDESVKKVRSTASMVLAGGLMMIGALMVLVIAGTGGITEAIQAGVSR